MEYSFILKIFPPSMREHPDIFGLHTSAPSHLGSMSPFMSRAHQEHSCPPVAVGWRPFLKWTWKPKSCSPPCSHSHEHLNDLVTSILQSVANCDGVLTRRTSQLITPARRPAQAELSTLFAFPSSKHCKKK